MSSFAQLKTYGVIAVYAETVVANVASGNGGGHFAAEPGFRARYVQ